MAWNEPGNGRKDDKGSNPWNRGSRNESGPPDLDQLLRKLKEKIKGFWRRRSGFGSGGSGSAGGSSFGGNGKGFKGITEDTELKFFGLLVVAVLLLIYALAGIYIVEPPERAVITRFGRYIRTEGPGPHWLPSFIESKEIVNIEQVATSDHSGLMLTRDRNIASVGVAVQYKIGEGEDDVRSYLFNVVNPEHSLKQSAESALRQVVGQSTMDEVLTLKRAEIATAIKAQLIETLNQYRTGIKVIDVAMQFAKPPDEVRAAFDDVIRAAADSERLVNQARAYENEVIPRAKGTVEKIKNEALGYKQETILIAEGNVQRFNSILPEYQKAPKVTQTRLYLDTLEEVLSNVTKVIVDSSVGNNLIYLPIDRMMQSKPAVSEAEYDANTSVNASGTNGQSNQAAGQGQGLLTPAQSGVGSREGKESQSVRSRTIREKS